MGFSVPRATVQTGRRSQGKNSLCPHSLRRLPATTADESTTGGDGASKVKVYETMNYEYGNAAAAFDHLRLVQPTALLAPSRSPPTSVTPPAPTALRQIQTRSYFFSPSAILTARAAIRNRGSDRLNRQSAVRVSFCLTCLGITSSVSNCIDSASRAIVSYRLQQSLDKVLQKYTDFRAPTSILVVQLQNTMTFCDKTIFYFLLVVLTPISTGFCDKTVKRMPLLHVHQTRDNLGCAGVPPFRLTDLSRRHHD